MPEGAFVDSTFWYDFFNESAGDHDLVLQEYDRFAGPLVTTSYVVAETVSLMCGRGHRYLAGVFLRELDESARCEVIHPDAEMFRVAVETFHERDDHPRLNLIDIISFVCMGAAGVTIALAKDKHFAMEGFTVLPPMKRM